MRRMTIPILAGLLTGLPPAFSAAPTPAPTPHRLVQEGIAVELSLARADGQPGPVREGEEARVTLAITATTGDTASGTPLSNLYPAAWMDSLAAGTKAGAECKKKVESFVGGSLLSRPALDLNAYYVLALNQDATISVVNPIFG